MKKDFGEELELEKELLDAIRRNLNINYAKILRNSDFQSLEDLLIGYLIDFDFHFIPPKLLLKLYYLPRNNLNNFFFKQHHLSAEELNFLVRRDEIQGITKKVVQCSSFFPMRKFEIRFFKNLKEDNFAKLIFFKLIRQIVSYLNNPKNYFWDEISNLIILAISLINTTQINEDDKDILTDFLTSDLIEFSAKVFSIKWFLGLGNCAKYPAPMNFVYPRIPVEWKIKQEWKVKSGIIKINWTGIEKWHEACRKFHESTGEVISLETEERGNSSSLNFIELS